MDNNKIINGIDVSECPCKDGDKCLEVPILNEYGDLIDYQDCEPQTLCPYRSKIKIHRLQKENEELKKQLEFSRTHKTVLDAERIKYKQALENIRTYINQECKNKQCPQICANCFMGNVLIKVNEVLNDRD